MTTFCGGCGNPLGAGGRFCGSCGALVAAQTATVDANGAAPAVPSAEPRGQQNEPGTGAARYAPTPDAPSTPPPSSPPPYSQAGPLYPQPGAPAVGGYSGQGDYPGPNGGDPSRAGSAPLPGVPWAGQRQPALGRDGIDSFLGGDWAGAALAASAAVASMLVIALVALLLADASQAGAHVLLSATVMLVCAGFGGDIFARAGNGLPNLAGGSGSANIGALPLTLTFVGCTVLAVLFLRRTRGTSTRDTLFQVVRVSLVLAGLTFILALVSRLHSGTDSGLLGIEGSVGASVASSIVGAVLFAVAALAIAVFLARPALLHPRLRSLRAGSRPALIGAGAVLAVGLLAALGGLVYTLSTQTERLAQIAGALLALPNVALGAVLLTMGVPLSGHGGASGLGSVTGIGQNFGSGSGSVNLLTLTGRSAWWWAAPVVLAATLVVVAVALVVRQHTLPAARREALRFAGCYALVAFVAALLVRIGANGGGGLVESSVSGQFSVEFNPLVAAVAAGLWGLAAGVLAPQLASAAGGGFVQTVRRRFGTAPAPTSQPVGGPYGAQPAAEHFGPLAGLQYGPPPTNQYSPPPAVQ